MKVKIGHTWYNASVVPIMVELTEEDKNNIANMHPDATKYAVFPDTQTWDKVEDREQYMKGNNEKNI